MNKAKAKGTLHERRFRDYARLRGHDAERIPSEGSADRGDVVGIRDHQGQIWAFECKWTAHNDLASAMREAKKESANAGAKRYAVIKHLNGHSISADMAIVPVWLLFDLINGEDTA